MIKLSYDMKVYREQLLGIIKPEDIVVELGCHVGKSSEVILDNLATGRLIGLDNSPEAISKMEKMEEIHDNFKFIAGDVRLHDILEKVAKEVNSCDILSVDLGGGYHPDTVFKVYYIWASTLKPRNTLIRNRGLIDFVNSAKTDEKIDSNEGWLESCGNQGIPPQIKEFSLWTDSLDDKTS